MTVLSLFTGAGGLDAGLEAAGFEITSCVEIDEDARQTLCINRPDWQLLTPGDIHFYTPKSLLKAANLKTGELKLLSGGPPCQPFSKSSYWASGDSKRLSDPRSETLVSYLALVKEALPEVLLIENVKGMGFKGKDEGVRLLVKGIEDINAERGTSYKVQILHVNAVDYGVPQSRERLFIIAQRDGKILDFPAPTHGTEKRSYLTAWDAICEFNDLSSPELELKGKWKDLLPSIPEGKNYLWHTSKGGGVPLFGWRTRYWSFLLKLSKQLPSWTIQAYPGPATGPFHWKNRLLSIEELARLQTFPIGYKFFGSYNSARVQVGNAVPSALGELFGLEILRQFYGKRVRRSLKLLPTYAGDVPESEPVKDIHKKYKLLIGNYADHPGIGLGPGAKINSRIR